MGNLEIYLSTCCLLLISFRYQRSECILIYRREYHLVSENIKKVYHEIGNHNKIYLEFLKFMKFMYYMKSLKLALQSKNIYAFRKIFQNLRILYLV